jgi:hypothetical protein
LHPEAKGSSSASSHKTPSYPGESILSYRLSLRRNLCLLNPLKYHSMFHNNSEQLHRAVSPSVTASQAVHCFVPVLTSHCWCDVTDIWSNEWKRGSFTFSCILVCAG